MVGAVGGGQVLVFLGAQDGAQTSPESGSVPFQTYERRKQDWLSLRQRVAVVASPGYRNRPLHRELSLKSSFG